MRNKLERGDIMRFAKMESLGNDYVYITAAGDAPRSPERLARFCADRRRGIGGDGMILITRSGKCDIRMRVFNPDGSEAEMCGNALRSSAALVYMKGLVCKENISVETAGGERRVKILATDGCRCRALSDLGVPEDVKTIANAAAFESGPKDAVSLSLGNPHCVVFCEDLETLDIRRYGQALEKSEYFPNGTNVHFCRVTGGGIECRSWERNCGETPSCATGAAAAFFCAGITGGVGKRAYVKHPGGELLAELNGDGHILITGETKLVFEGEFMPEAVE